MVLDQGNVTIGISSQSAMVYGYKNVVKGSCQVIFSHFQVYNKIYEADVDFPMSKPGVKVTGGRLVVNTTTNVKYGITTTALYPQTAEEIEAKMKRMEALKKEAEKGGLNLGFKEAVSCKDVNRVSCPY